MASYTENLNLKKPERTDKFSIEDYNTNLEKIDNAVNELGGTESGITLTYLNSRLGGLTLVPLTQSEYDALSSHDENTLYIIKES